MIIVKAMGGLGNQLQQYALYEKMISLGKEAALDTGWFESKTVQENMLAPRKLELEYFQDLSFRKATKEEIENVYGKEDFLSKVGRKLNPKSNHRFFESGMYHPEIFGQDPLYVEGYWAAEKYYADILPILREKLKFPEPNALNKEVEKQIEQVPYAVSMHVRRGDYLDPVNREMFGDISTEAYYETAINMIKEKHPDAKFFVFSDDQAYVRETYGTSEFISVDINHGADSFFDIYLMSKCDAHICANSTFSFWGARLNEKEDKVMIRPSIHKNSQIFIPEQMHDFWKGWILIDKNGKCV